MPNKSKSKTKRYADAMPIFVHRRFSIVKLQPMSTSRLRYLAVLVLIGISDSESRDTISVGHRVCGIQECKRSIASLLRVVGRQELLETGASSKIILKCDVRRQVRARVKGAGSLSIIEASGESVLEHPVGAGFWCIEALSCAIAGVVDAVLEEKIDLGHDAGDVDAAEVANASTVIGRCLETGELMLGDLSFADRVVVIGISTWEHVDISVVIIILITDAETLESGTEDGGGEEEGRENGVG